MVWEEQSQLMVMPRVNLAGPMSDISHLVLRSDLNFSSSSGEEAAAKMLSIWTEKMTVLEGEEW